LAVTTTAAVARRWGVRRAALAAAAVGGGTVLVEAVGTTTGIPFGRYRYSGRLRPTVLGVPVVVPAAWWAMAVPAREAANAALGRRSGPAARIGLGALALASWDLFLDPQMTGEDFWRWSIRGRYRGIPLSNFVGWLITGAVVMAALEVLLPPGRPEPGLVGTYAGMGVMETLGFAAFFGDRVVAAIGGAAMLPIGVLGLARLRHA
jgi:putative membrane protein